jgi:tRNA threonylcarbamoyl adenosine modification protein YeaZ
VNQTRKSVLSIDLSSTKGSVCVHSLQHEKLELLAEEVLSEPMKHSETLISAVQRALRGQSLADVSRFVTACGPGSFTGLRVAYASLKAFCLATGSPLDVVDGHEARALAYADLHPLAREITVATQMTRDAFWVSQFVRSQDGTVQRVWEEKRDSLPETSGALLVDKESHRGVYFPLHARFLAEGLSRCASRRSFHTEAELATASPVYFGSKPYG